MCCYWVKYNVVGKSMKVRIALCDDNELQLSMVEDIVSGYFKDRRIDAEINTFTEGKKLLEDVRANGCYGLYILDMLMPVLNGMDVGTELRNMGDDGHIVFLTATDQYAVKSYEVSALYYLVKPIDAQKIEKVLDLSKLAENYFASTKAEGDFFEVVGKEKTQQIRISDIEYVDLVARRLCFHMKNKEIYESVMLRTKFSDSVAQLSQLDGFVASGTVLVNKAYITRISTNEIRFESGECLTPSKRVAKELYKIING